MICGCGGELFCVEAHPIIQGWQLVKCNTCGKEVAEIPLHNIETDKVKFEAKK